MAVLAPESGVIEELLIPDGEKVTQKIPRNFLYVGGSNGQFFLGDVDELII